MGYRDRVKGRGPRKLLALDGGGIRGVLTLQILAAIEGIVRTKLARKNAVLGDYFGSFARYGSFTDQHHLRPARSGHVR
jgi:hypothetical protein